MTKKLQSILKNCRTAVVVAGLATLAFASCSKSSSSPYSMSGSATSSSGTTTPVSVSGQTYVFAQIVSNGSGGNQLALTGESWGGGDTTGFSFEISNYTGAGTYNLADTGTNANVAVYVNHSATSAIDDISASGSLVISSVTSTQITGTFNFVGTAGTKINNGKFTALIVP